jgi:hypothetical protein
VFFEEEEVLSRLLRGIPDAPVSSNFTARVLTAAALARARSALPERPGWMGWLRWWGATFRRSLALRVTAVLFLALGLSAYPGVQSFRRHQLVQSLATVSKVASIPDIEVLQDFDAIRLLGRVQASKSTMEMDAALLAALQ